MEAEIRIPDRISTPVTELLGIRYPIIQGGMIWVSGWKLAVAVSKAGGLGLIGSGSMTPEVLRKQIEKAQAVWDGPLGVNLPLMRQDATELIKIVIESGIRVVSTSAGNPATFTDLLHQHGILVIHVVPSLKLALKAVARGVDVIVGEGTEAGGHNGFEEIPTFPLIPRLVDHLAVPVIAAGGIRDGRGLVAALALGADGVQIGTRFACSMESSASSNYKHKIIESTEPATRLTLRKFSPTRMLNGIFSQRALEAESRGADRDELADLVGTGRARKGIFEGDLVDGFMEAGEVAADLDRILSVQEIFQDLLTDFVKCLNRLNRIKL